MRFLPLFPPDFLGALATFLDGVFSILTFWMSTYCSSCICCFGMGLFCHKAGIEHKSSSEQTQKGKYSYQHLQSLYMAIR